MTFRRNPDSPLKTGVVNYRNRPFNKFYMVDVYVGNQSPAGQVKVAVDDLSGEKPKRIIVPYGQHLRDEYANPLMVAPPSIPVSMEPEMQFGPYKSRRAAAVDAKTIVRNILLGTGDGGTGGTITEMYELTDGGNKYMQKREFPPSSIFKSVGGAAVGNNDKTDIVVGYLGIPDRNAYPIYARIQTILPNQKVSDQKLQKKIQDFEDNFLNTWEELEVPVEELDDAMALTDNHWYEPHIFGAPKSKKKAAPAKKAAPKVKLDFKRDSKGAYEIFIGEKRQSKKITKPKELKGGFRFDMVSYKTLKEAKAAAEKFYSNVRSNPKRHHSISRPRTGWSSSDAEFNGNPSETIYVLVDHEFHTTLAELIEDNPEEYENLMEISHGEEGDMYDLGNSTVEIIAIGEDSFDMPSDDDYPLSF